MKEKKWRNINENEKKMAKKCDKSVKAAPIIDPRYSVMKMIC